MQLHFVNCELKAKMDRKFNNNRKSLTSMSSQQRQHSKLILHIVHVYDRTIVVVSPKMKMLYSVQSFTLVRTPFTSKYVVPKHAHIIYKETFLPSTLCLHGTKELQYKLEQVKKTHAYTYTHIQRQTCILVAAAALFPPAPRKPFVASLCTGVAGVCRWPPPDASAFLSRSPGRLCLEWRRMPS